jgi:hypothetical protein
VRTLNIWHIGTYGFHTGFQKFSNFGQKRSLTTHAYEPRKADDISVLTGESLGITGKMKRDTSIEDSS